MNPKPFCYLAALVASAVLVFSPLQASEERPAEAGKSISVTLLGEFEKVDLYRLPQGTTLLQAVAAAGGFTDAADLSEVRLVRNLANDEVTARRIDAGRLLRGEARDLLLEDRDLIVANAVSVRNEAPAEAETGGNPGDLAGTWMDDTMLLILHPDGRFWMRSAPLVFFGEYEITGNRIQMTEEESGEIDFAEFELAGDVLVLSAPGEESIVLSRQEFRMRPTVDYAMGEFPQSVALADLDGDGRLDVMTANREDHSVTVRLGAGDGTFGDPVDYPTGREPLFVRAADLNGDGIPDLVTANRSNTLTVFPGNGDGTFGEPVAISVGEGDPMPINVVAADFTGDGIVDLATANFLANSVSLFPGKGNFEFGEPVSISVGDGPVSIAAEDFNNDGNIDLAVANRRENTATILLGDGNGGFSASEVGIGERAGFLVAGDLNNDGIVDLAVACFLDHSVSVLIGDGEGGFTRRDLDAELCTPSSLALGDFDGDGWLDIATVCQNLGGVAVLLNGGDAGFFAPPIGFRAGSAPDAIAAGDLNEDGFADLVTANLGGGSVSVLLSGEGEAGRGLGDLRYAPAPRREIAEGEVTLVVEFETPEGVSADFEEVQVYVLDAEYPSVPDALRFSSREKSFQATFENLPAGEFYVYVFTGSDWAEMHDASRPGAFFSIRNVTLDGSKDAVTHAVQYQAFDAEALRGAARANGKVVDIEGNPVPGLDLRVTSYSQTAGTLVLGTTRTDDAGRFEFENLAEGQTYEVDQEDGGVSGFVVPGTEATLFLPPQVGQMAPEIEFVHLESGETQKLSDFRGKVVLVDFWASWCGPCEAPMEKMQLYRDQNPGWGEQVELIALSIDDTRRAAEVHLKAKGWNRSYNTWAGPGGFRSEAAEAFRIRAIPTFYLVGPDGRIAATGHPFMDLPRLINRVLSGG